MDSADPGAEPDRAGLAADLAAELAAGTEAKRGAPSRTLERWYRAEHPTVWRLCLGFLADRLEADDAAQDAMLHLRDQIHRWDPARPWASWRNAVVLNLCRDRMRRAASRRRAEEHAAALRLPPELPDPRGSIDRAELSRMVAESLGLLSEREREAFVLHDLEGRPTGEVAELMSIAAGSVRALLTLGRRRLRNALAPRLGQAAGGGGVHGA